LIAVYYLVDMANISIRGIPESVYEKLSRLADKSKRSINKEVILILEIALKNEK
jgi:plasmid stability protein